MSISVSTCGMFSDPKLAPMLELMSLRRLWRLHILCEAGRAESWAQAARAAARREEPMGRLDIRAAVKGNTKLFFLSRL